MSIVSVLWARLRQELQDWRGGALQLRLLSQLQSAWLLMALLSPQPALAQPLEGAPTEGWAHWQVPKQAGTGVACCIDGADLKGRGCNLDARANTYHVNASASELTVTDRLDVYVRFAGSEAVEVRAYDAQCPVHSAAPPIELASTSPDSSARWLAAQSLRGHSSPGRKSELGEGALVALALHATPVASSALIDLSAAGKPDGLRRNAAFWLGQVRGEAGIEQVLALSRGAESDGFLEHLAFVLSESELPQARAGLSALAGAGRSDSVRGGALFWIAQAGWDDAEQRILAALAVDATPELQEKAVFALSQLKDGGDEALIRLLQGSYPRAAKKQALFWLGQSGSDRALEFLDRHLADGAG
ncbi:hypothetical protein [Aquimonas sp.]|jgi:hypothetical protein|uniref:hypothetical protein n=1 Tax=Aquimonas sp. TaxID=1872588 RepID=UPI0037C1A375